MSHSRNWVFTINANEENGEEVTWPCPGLEPHPLADWMDSGKIDYLVYQCEEAPSTHKIHLQGYCQFNTTMRLAAVKKISATAHWEVRHGTHEQAVAYCKKEESRLNGPWEVGQATGGQGKRNDLEAIHNLVLAKKTNLEILEEVGAGASRFAKNITWLRFTDQEADSDRQLVGMKVLTLYGATGMGKTYAAVNVLAGGKDYYMAECPSHKDSKLWFDGYEGQKTLILDDFSGDFCAFRFLLRLLDKYKLKVEVKGGHAWAVWTTVVITSNIHPSGWYSSVDLAPLKRRLTENGSEIRLTTERGLYQLVDWDDHPIGDIIPFAPHDQIILSAPASPQLGEAPATGPTSSHTEPDCPPTILLTDE